MGIFGDILTSIKANSATSDSVVGIDVGSSSIKVVELKEKKGVITLVTYGEIQLGPYAGKSIGESVVLDSKQEQEALVDIIRESAVKAKEAVLAMPLSSSFVTNVSIETSPDSDLASMVRVEARKVIPASLSEVTLDWAEVEVSEKTKSKKENVKKNILIASIQNSALERFNVLMKFVGMTKPPTEIECFSSIRGLYSNTEDNIAIVDLGAVSSKLYIARNGLLMRMHRIRAGGAVATEQIASAKGVSFEEAEELKLSLTREDREFQELKKIHDSGYDRAFREFNQVIKEYEDRTGNTIKNVYMTGGGSLFSGIDAHLRSVLDREVVLANPFTKVAYPAFMEDNMVNIGPSFSVAIGAALRVYE